MSEPVFLPETTGSTYPTPRQIENGEAQAGGLDGLWNEHAKNMVERTNWLKTAITALQSAFLPAASQVQAEAGIDDTTTMTPLRVKQFATLGFAVLLSGNGYIKFPDWMGGLIIQWGTGLTLGGSGTWVYPIAFPNAALQAFATQDGGASGATFAVGASASGSLTSATLRSALTSGGDGFHIFAIGY